MKILIVTPEFPPDCGGGIATFYANLAPALRKHGWSVMVIKGSAFSHGNGVYEWEAVPTCLLETERFLKWQSRFAHFGMFPELRRHLAAAFAIHEQAREGDGFDIVEVTDWGLLFLPWMMSANSRVTVQLHGSVGQIFKHDSSQGREAEAALSLLLETSGLRAAPGLCSYSHSNADWWRQLLERNVDYVPPLLSSRHFSRTPVADSDTWCTVARIQHWKGPHVACAAWNLLGCNAPALQWIGRDTPHGSADGSTDRWLQRQFPSIWRNRINPTGPLLPAQVVDYVRGAKAILVPSTWDVFNLAAAEAMGLRKVVVISSGAGAAELVEDGINGFLFPNGDATALAEAVRTVGSLNIKQREAIGEAAASTVEQQLNAARVVTAKTDLYRRLPAATPDVSWLRESLFIGASMNSLEFLEQMPLRPLGSYVVRRLVDKLIS